MATLTPVTNGGSRVFRVFAALSVAFGVIAVPSIGALQSSATAAQTVTITEYRAGLPTDANAYVHPDQIVAGPDGNLWFTGRERRRPNQPGDGRHQDFSTGPATGRRHNVASPSAPTRTCGSASRPALPSVGSPPLGSSRYSRRASAPAPYAITSGADGNLWFTESGSPSGYIGRITPAGVVTEFPAPLAAGALGIVAGPDGNVWYLGSGSVGRVTPAGVVTTFPTPGEGGARITVGPDGALWASGNHVERITMQGVVTSFPTGTGINGGLVGIVTGPDGALWVAETSNQIARITTTGDVTQYRTGISAGAGPQEITVGPDGNLWFTESGQTEREANRASRRRSSRGYQTYLCRALLPASTEPTGLARRTRLPTASIRPSSRRRVSCSHVLTPSPTHWRAALSR